jgi:hypothetical protein
VSEAGCELNRHGVPVYFPATSHSKLTARLVVMALVMDARARDGNRFTTPATIGALAEMTRASVTAVRAGIRELKALGELEVTDAGQLGQVFTVILPEAGPPPPKACPSRPPIPIGVRAYVLARDGWKCVTCGCPDDLTIDHVWPWSKGGTSEAGNLQTLCRPCNSSKGARV